MKRKKHAFPILMWIFAACGSGLLLFPFFADAVTGLCQMAQIAAYEKETGSQASLEEQREKAAAYNRMIAEEQRAAPFSYRGSEASDEVYEEQLSGPDGQMCVLEVPSADIRLPVLHGTTEGALTVGAGHMYGTSLPYGGPDSHCLLAGHTGLPTALLFTNLRKVEKGDEVLITVLGEVHRYTVSDIIVVLPEDEEKYMQICPGEDLVTLYTCTPYGINDHRLLVRCRRVLTDLQEAAGSGPEESGTFLASAGKLAVRTVLFAAAPVMVIVFGILSELKKYR